MPENTSFQPKSETKPSVKLSTKYVRRGIMWTLALIMLAALTFVGYGWKSYRQNLSINDAGIQMLPELTSSDRILVLSPHPDDETLGVGGFIAMARQRGIPVHTVFLTNGDGSLSTRLVRDAHLLEQVFKGRKITRGENTYRNIALIRQEEALAAQGKLGVAAHDVTFLGYPDGGTKKMWEMYWDTSHLYKSPYTKADHSPYKNSWTSNAPYCGQQVVGDLTQILADFKPTILITTNPYDTHPDHWAAYAYLMAAVHRLQQQEKYFSWAQRIRCYTFLIHHGPWPVPHGYNPHKNLTPPAALLNSDISWFNLPLDQTIQNDKTAALNQYQSQLSVTPQFLRSFLRKNELLSTSSIVRSAPSQWKMLLRDPKQDLLLPEVVGASDVVAIDINQQPKVLLVRMNMDGKLWKGLRYVLTLHGISGDDISLGRITITPNKNSAAMTIATKMGTRQKELQITSSQKQLTIAIPADIIRAMTGQSTSSKSVLLISASSFFRDKALDTTPTRIVDIEQWAH